MNDTHSSSTAGEKGGAPLLRAILGLAGAALLALLAVSIWRGAPTDWVVRLGKPKGVIAIIALCWITAAALGASTRPGGMKRLIQKLVLMGFGLGVSLVAGEWITRAWLKTRPCANGLNEFNQWAAGGELRLTGFTPLAAITQLSADRRLVYELRPNLNMDFGPHTLRTNSRGFRSDREPAPEATNAVRIVGIGDSGMFGWGVHQGQDYMSVLGERLKARGGRAYEVLNFAVPGYNTGQEVEMLRSRGLAWHPKIVIVGWCDNDFSAPFIVLKKKTYSDPRKLYFYSLLFYRTELLSEDVAKLGEIDQSLVDPVVLEYTDVSGVKKALLEVRELGNAHGFHVLVFGSMRKEAVGICRELGLDYFNTRERVDASKYPSDYAVHFMHPAGGGHRVLAEHLQAELQRLGWLDQE